MDRLTAVARLSNHALTLDLTAVVHRDTTTTAEILVRLGEFDDRRLYAEHGYSSMHAYCVEALHFSDDIAYKRITVARAARKVPELLEVIADGRLHLSGAVVLVPQLTRENAAELLALVTWKKRCEIEELIAARFPKPAVPQVVRAIPVRKLVATELAPGRVQSESLSPTPAALAPTSVPAPSANPVALELAPGRVPQRCDQVAPLSSETFAIQFTASRSTRDKLRRAQELIGYPAGREIAGVVDRALDLLIAELEKRKFAATDNPRKSRPSRRARHIPADVKRKVWERDRGRCSFVSESGHHCSAKTGLEFDHIEPVARGGKSTADNLRLRCRAHNQLEAERLFGAGFMHEKRDRSKAG